MNYLMDYLPAIQFAAALNLGYIIPNILKKMYNVLYNVKISYKGLFEEVNNKIVIKIDEINHIKIVYTTDARDTSKIINQLIVSLNNFRTECQKKESSLNSIIEVFTSCSGFRSLFFCCCLYSILELIIIPFCFQHNDIWTYQFFLYLFSVSTFLYIVYLFIFLIKNKNDVSCQGVLFIEISLLLLSAIIAIVNSYLPQIFVLESEIIAFLSFLSVLVPFLPGTMCILFLIILSLYSSFDAKRFVSNNIKMFDVVDKTTKKLNDFNDFLDGKLSTQ